MTKLSIYTTIGILWLALPFSAFGQLEKEIVVQNNFGLESVIGIQHNYLGLSYENTVGYKNSHSSNTYRHSLGYAFTVGDIFLAFNHYRQSGSSGVYYSFQWLSNKQHNKPSRDKVIGMGVRLRAGLKDKKSWVHEPSNRLMNPTQNSQFYYDYTKGTGQLNSAEIFFNRGFRFYPKESSSNYFYTGGSLGIRIAQMRFTPKVCQTVDPNGHVEREWDCGETMIYRVTPWLINFNFAYYFR